MSNQKIIRTLALSSIALAMAALPGVTRAESNYQTGAGALTATAHVDFTIIIPKILFLQVGTGTLNATNAAVDLITFTVPAANVGDASVISGTGGDQTLGVVTAKVKGNSGNITLSAITPAAIHDGVVAENIDWGQITTTPSLLTTATVLAAPTLTTSTTTTVALVAVNKVVNQDAKWTYKYLNANVPTAGTYGGVNTNNSRVTYSVSLP